MTLVCQTFEEIIFALFLLICFPNPPCLHLIKEALECLESRQGRTLPRMPCLAPGLCRELRGKGSSCLHKDCWATWFGLERSVTRVSLPQGLYSAEGEDSKRKWWRMKIKGFLPRNLAEYLSSDLKEALSCNYGILKWKSIFPWSSLLLPNQRMKLPVMSEITRVDRKQWLKACNGFELLCRVQTTTSPSIPSLPTSRSEHKKGNQGTKQKRRWNTKRTKILLEQQSWQNVFRRSLRNVVTSWFPARDVLHPYYVLTDSSIQAASTEHISLTADGTKDIALPWEPSVVTCSPLGLLLLFFLFQRKAVMLSFPWFVPLIEESISFLKSDWVIRGILLSFKPALLKFRSKCITTLHFQPQM